MNFKVFAYKTILNCKKLSQYIYVALFLYFAWWGLALILNKPVMPNPHQAFGSLIFNFKNDLLLHVAVSLYRVLISLIIAILFAVPLGLLLGKNLRIDKYIAPMIYFTYPIPKVVLMPIFFILLGVGDFSKIALISMIVFFQILVTTRDAARNLEKEYLLSIKSLGANSYEVYRHVYLPGCLPAILTSLRIGLGIALAVLFLVETYATQTGIGFFIMESLTRMAYDAMFAGIIAMGSLGFFLYIIIDILERKLCAWVQL